MTIFDDVIIKNGAFIVPESLRQDILAKAYSTHEGIVRTKQYLQNALYWPGMSSEVEEMCKDCRICRQLLPQEKIPLFPVERPEGPSKYVLSNLIITSLYKIFIHNSPKYIN